MDLRRPCSQRKEYPESISSHDWKSRSFNSQSQVPESSHSAFTFLCVSSAICLGVNSALALSIMKCQSLIRGLCRVFERSKLTKDVITIVQGLRYTNVIALIDSIVLFRHSDED